MFPGGMTDGNPLGVAVHGGYAYAAMQVWLGTYVSRLNLSTGAAEACLFVGSVNCETNNADIFNSALMVDGENITLFGSVSLFKDENTATEPFFGAVRIPLSKAEWCPIEALEDGSLLAQTAGIRAYRYRGAPSSGEFEDGASIQLSAFALEGELTVMDHELTQNGTRIDVSRLSFAESESPSPLVNGTMAGTLVPAPVDSVFMPNPTEQNMLEYYRTYCKYSAYFGMFGAAFPQAVNGVGAARVAQCSISNVGEQFSPDGVSVQTILDGESFEAGGSEVRSAGIGFCRIARDKMGGKTRYYLDTGAYLEFDKDGRLVV